MGKKKALLKILCSWWDGTKCIYYLNILRGIDPLSEIIFNRVRFKHFLLDIINWPTVVLLFPYGNQTGHFQSIDNVLLKQLTVNILHRIPQCDCGL